jgi:hypothetical protein
MSLTQAPLYCLQCHCHGRPPKTLPQDVKVHLKHKDAQAHRRGRNLPQCARSPRRRLTQGESLD